MKPEDMQRTPCSVCGKKPNPITLSPVMRELDGKVYCPEHFNQRADELSSTITITSTPSIEGKRITSYINFDSVEVVLGTGMFTEFDGNLADLTGTRSGEFESKLDRGKRAALRALKLRTFLAGGNAVVGLDLDYVTFSGNKFGIIASGTIVIAE